MKNSWRGNPGQTLSVWVAVGRRPRLLLRTYSLGAVVQACGISPPLCVFRRGPLVPQESWGELGEGKMHLLSHHHPLPPELGGFYSLLLFYSRIIPSATGHVIGSVFSGAPNVNFRNICSEDDLRSRIFGTFVVKLLACLPLLGFSNI